MKLGKTADFQLFESVVGCDPTPEVYYRFSESLANQCGVHRPAAEQIARALWDAAGVLPPGSLSDAMLKAKARLEGGHE